MERFAVCLDDADLAHCALAPLLAADCGPAHCLLVICPPGLGRRIGRWLTPALRHQWRDDWAAQFRLRMAPVLAQAAPGVAFDWVVARQPLSIFTRELRGHYGAGLRLIDARRQHPGSLSEPMTASPAATGRRFAAPVAVASSLSLLLALTD